MRIAPMKVPTLFAMLGIAAYVGACSSEVSGPRTANGRYFSVKAAANAELAAAAQGRTTRGFEDEILRMETLIPTLGGVFADRSGHVVIYLKDLSQRQVALAALQQIAPTLRVNAAFRAKLGNPNSTIVRQGNFAFSELVAWEKQIGGGVRMPGLVGIDADESQNRVRVITTGESSNAALLAAIAAAGVPDSAVVFDTQPMATFASTLRDSVRATGGGLQIMNVNHAICSLGFNVDVDVWHTEGFLTASHCDPNTLGNGDTGAVWFQDTSVASREIGIVSLNPAWTRTDLGCMGKTLCTDADAEFVHSTDTLPSAWAKRIAWTTTQGSGLTPGGITIASTWSTGISIVPFTYVGAPVFRVGRTTGTISDTISYTCVDRVVDSNHTILCSDEVDNSTWGKGDSGGAVYYPADPGIGEPPYAIGIFFGGSSTTYDSTTKFRCTAGCTWLFSEWGAIENHLARTFTP